MSETVAVPIKDFQDLLGLIDPPPVKTPSGTVMVFVNPHSAEVLTRISAIVRRMHEAALATTQRVAVPDGYALAPIEPTEEMLDAARGIAIDWPDGFPNHLEGYRAMLAAAPQAADPIKRLIAMHNELLGENSYCYFELAYTRRTDWMAWLCTKPREDDPERKVLACGQGLTAEEACAEAISAAQKGGAA